MDLLERDSEYLNDENRRKLWRFLRDTQIYWLLLHPRTLNKVLNDYLLFMRKQYRMYGYHFFDKDDGNYIDVDDLELQQISGEHLTTFETLYINDRLIDNRVNLDEIMEMRHYYEDLLMLVEKITGYAPIYNKKFTKNDLKALSAIYGKPEKINFECFLPQTKIYISLMTSDFNVDMHKKIAHNKSCYKYKIHGLSHYLIFDNSNNIFSYVHIFDLKKCLFGPTQYYIKWDCVQDDNVHMFFTNERKAKYY